MLPLHTALLCCLFAQADAFRFPDANEGAAELRSIDGIPILRVGGTPEEMGAAIGKLALKPAFRVLEYPRGLLRKHNAELMWGPFRSAGKGMYRQFPQAAREELEAIVRASGAEHELVVAGNTFFDLKKLFACSAMGVQKEASATGGTLLGRNLDYPSLDYIHRYSLVTVYRPKGKLAFACVGFPGLVGVLSGMNEAGLALGVLEVYDIKEGEKHFDIKGVPYGLCLRAALEEARTIDEAVAVLRKFRRTAMINVAIADTRDVAVLEVSPERVLKRTGKGTVCVTNHYCTTDLKPARATNIIRTLDRFARLEQAGNGEGKMGPEQLRQHLDAVNLGELTLQTMVFEPATLRLHLSIGRTPASKYPLQKIELGDRLRGTEKR